ncbi:MAG: Flp pilus assembly complex ATPase component TadA, partial [Verrucomicrobia bacterium]|nr:Flp pilus assembly complex ATPase component TadA [Verrucomicrobiota bacterium]
MILSNILIKKKLITKEQLDQALELKNAKGMRLDRALIQIGAISEKDLLNVLGEELHLPVVNLSQVQADPEAIKLLPTKLVYRRGVMPLSLKIIDGASTLEVAMSNPFDLEALDDIQVLTGKRVRAVLGIEAEVERLIKEYYGLGGDTINELTGGLNENSTEDIQNEDLMEMAQEASVIKLVNEIIVEAVNERASDIHVEPYENELSIRYRIDGVLHPASVPAQIHQLQAAIISRIKILANLNIAERRLPQDGRIKFQVGGRQIDVRVSVIPMIFG